MEAFKKSFGMAEKTGSSLLERYFAVRKYTEFICDPLIIEDYVVQPMPDVSPPKWHLAHTTWFFEEIILVNYLPGYKRFHPRYSFLFNSYYEGAGKRVPRPDRGTLSRPSVNEVHEYRAHVDENMIRLLSDLPSEAAQLIELGMNHEQQHQELLYTDIKYILGQNPLYPIYHSEFQETPEREAGNGFVDVPGGQYHTGNSGEQFCYDNERPVHPIILQDYSIRASLVTNREYIEFIDDGGYDRHEFWLSDGWAWLKEQHVKTPLYWTQAQREWYRYALCGLEKLNEDEPVTHVSFYEASAFAEWKGMRLPTEFEWEVAAQYLSWGLRWEYTNSAMLPYPGYKKPEGLLGEYNGKFMVNTMVLRGASVVTPAGHSRPTYRNFFYPHQQWQFTGIRLCKS